ncbi:MAG: cache domain-containing protein [bacterium]
MKISIGIKLNLIFFFIISIIGIFSLTVGINIINSHLREQTQEKIFNDLNSARMIYQNKIKDVGEIIHLTANRFFLKESISFGYEKRIVEELNNIKQEEGLDILNVTDENGTVVIRSNNLMLRGDDLTNDDLIRRVLREKKLVAAIDISSYAELEKESSDLVTRAYFKFIDTPKARFRKESEEKTGMMIKAAAPIFDYENNFIGILYGGILLNRNYEIVDRIKQTVFQNIKYNGKDIGSATLFQDDLRISTNVMHKDGSRAIGTRVSEEVYHQVVINGKKWIGRAYVVNNWYISAYEPLRNINDKIIGMLYVGILEEKLIDMQRETIFYFLAITFIGLIISMLLSFFFSHYISSSIKKLVVASQQMASGDLGAQVRLKSNDELRELADTFNFMASALRERHESIKELARKKIMESERLAIIGQLSAGIAHEINNPLQGILAYSYLILEKLSHDDPNKESIKKIVKQATRCKDIIRGLLDFAREREPEKKIFQINLILRESISLVQIQSLFHNIEISENLNENLPLTLVDPSQIQQVFMNIIINAAEAMAGDGKLSIVSREESSKKFIEIAFTDTGHGVSEKNMNKIFDPFFTTKEVGLGTGLGLAVSYGIIKQHNGTIEVKSKVNEGTTFIVSLPIIKKG